MFSSINSFVVNCFVIDEDYRDMNAEALWGNDIWIAFDPAITKNKQIVQQMKAVAEDVEYEEIQS